MCWFSSSHDTEVSEDALKSDKKFPGHDASAMRSMPEHHEVSRPNNAVIPINDSSKRCVSMGEQMNSETSDIDDPATLSQLSFAMGSDTKSESKNGLMPKDQVSFCEFKLMLILSQKKK